MSKFWELLDLRAHKCFWNAPMARHPWASSSYINHIHYDHRASLGHNKISLWMSRVQDDPESIGEIGSYPSIFTFSAETSLIARFMGPTWGPPGVDRTQVGPVLAPWTLLSGIHYVVIHWNLCFCIGRGKQSSLHGYPWAPRDPKLFTEQESCIWFIYFLWLYVLILNHYLQLFNDFKLFFTSDWL